MFVYLLLVGCLGCLWFDYFVLLMNYTWLACCFYILLVNKFGWMFVTVDFCLICYRCLLFPDSYAVVLINGLCLVCVLFTGFGFAVGLTGCCAYLLFC